MLPYLSHKAYMQSRYGEALFSIPVNLEFGCPNREHDGSGGCSFCPEHGARAAQIADAKSVEEQIAKGVAFAKKRYKAKRFALYIQAYTGTFASVLTQKEQYEKLLKMHAFDALHIGTRPDCLNSATLEYLQSLNQMIDVCVELGVQTSHDETLRLINRGHDFAKSKEAIFHLQHHGIKVYAHIIVGFSNETRAHWLSTTEELVKLGVDGIKIHHLHVIKNTELAHQYALKPFKTFSEYEYAEELMEILRRIPSHIPILRIATDTPDKDLVAPLWHMQKGQFGEYLVKTMRYRGIRQGDLVENNVLKNDVIQNKIVANDGSTTFWNKTYKDYYHPKAGAYTQAQALFIKQSRLEERLLKGDVKLLDIGFGMGYNTLESVKVAQKVAKHTLHVKAIDQDRMLLKQSMQTVPESLHVKILDALFTCKHYEDHFATVAFLNAEARYALTLLDEPFDVIYLDPFLESNNASLVSLELFQTLKKLLKKEGVLVCSTVLTIVQIALKQAGFTVQVCNDEASDIKGLVATHSIGEEQIDGSPYRDIYGIWSDKEIAKSF
ncbi:TIGR01212 family radical SAM protein [Sulfurospirillum oryzae]|uniref:TIGR01212 family radical SAM protein n=1 Tax=Sulfurospirillum oryzae TaxID=2976535 RepID=UPI0021E83A99|nr:TIGR01212 family radical SAM protein [Sulfurospirillum oryzae]